MRSENAPPNRCPRLEQAGAHRHVLHFQNRGGFGRRAALEITKHEHFALSHRKCRSDSPDEIEGTFAVHSTARIGDVDVVRLLDRWNRRAPSAQRDAPSDAVEPRVEWTVSAIAPELAVHPDENFLRDVLGLVAIARQGECAPKDTRLVRGHERSERGVISVARARDELERLDDRHRKARHWRHESTKRSRVYSN